MRDVQQISVQADDDGMRLDRWLARQLPQLSHGRIEKLLRTGQVRLDGRRAKSGARVAPGQMVRIPPLPDAAADAGSRPAPAAPPPVRAAEAAALQARVLYRDEVVLAIDKPAGLAVQGGPGAGRHLDSLLEALRFEAPERPRLVHRLDRDTSGVLLLARTAAAARALTGAFRGKDVRKLYWAAVAGVPKPAAGRIALPLAKRPGAAAKAGGELVRPDPEDGLPAVTLYRTVEIAGKRAAWLALSPLTGRTHQLRAHCAALGTPILGDGKYGGRAAFLPGAGIPAQVHLHARRLVLPHPGDGHGATIDVTAPLPPHMVDSWSFLGFDPSAATANDIL
ncbi:MAG: RluA family pseudouridine synthase [Alphaproteobacteria bacterium]|jgi:23S rRNA pseudouridine955/2504/2580 synthase|nr:RluA family pseudouridine synthase [Alphaproteobacteria bacterium]